MSDKITLAHGDGGLLMNRLIKEVISSYAEPVNSTSDSFVFEKPEGTYAFTTDSFVVNPLFFKGGDIGKLSICGTVNDLATAGAVPLFISVGFIIEEGFSIESLYKIAHSMGETCKRTGAKIVTGDTKVVEKGCADGLYINTSGIGRVLGNYTAKKLCPGDEILITGSIAEHGTAITNARYQLDIEGDFESDCAPMNDLVQTLTDHFDAVKRMKDPTRGGLAEVLNEIAAEAGLNAELTEMDIPMKQQVRAGNDLLGTDPYYLACEGRMLLIVKAGCGEEILKSLKSAKGCGESKVIGFITEEKQGIVYMKTAMGGKRMLPPLEGQTIPRIC